MRPLLLLLLFLPSTLSTWYDISLKEGVTRDPILPKPSKQSNPKHTSGKKKPKVIGAEYGPTIMTLFNEVKGGYILEGVNGDVLYYPRYNISFTGKTGIEGTYLFSKYLTDDSPTDSLKIEYMKGGNVGVLVSIVFESDLGVDFKEFIDLEGKEYVSVIWSVPIKSEKIVGGDWEGRWLERKERRERVKVRNEEEERKRKERKKKEEEKEKKKREKGCPKCLKCKKCNKCEN
ncbi:hypothetical protein TL16_g12992 [Triparma laevis f. inornata]|uniref:Uncharacterized protein n=1 Tax=Triparma laevis f. inornata TaxID=1714386 RepID=A0A9W7BXX4_9STRA|nr:hypothetical protein TL16_g12992 [Triparma laevis f. inornata]